MNPSPLPTLRILLLSLCLVPHLLAILGTRATVHAEDTVPVFYLKAWHIAHSPPAQIDHYIELDPTNGDALVNYTQGYKGFASIQVPPTNGSLYKLRTGEQGFLLPLASPSRTYGKIHPKIPQNPSYQLRYTHGLPPIPGILSTKFAITTYSCGGKCAGRALIYDDVLRPEGSWYLSPDKTRKGWWVNFDGKKVWSGVWRVRWVWGEHFPVDAVYGVALWMLPHGGD